MREMFLLFAFLVIPCQGNVFDNLPYGAFGRPTLNDAIKSLELKFENLSNQFDKEISDKQTKIEHLTSKLIQNHVAIEQLTLRVDQKDSEIHRLTIEMNNLKAMFDYQDDDGSPPSLESHSQVNKANMKEFSTKQDHFVLKNKTLEQRVEHLEDLSRTQVLRSCHEYLAFGITTSGYFMIDPDGTLIGHPPFEVFCNFEEQTTDVLHDKDGITLEIEPCSDPKCFRIDLNYNAPMEQITALKDISQTCTQFIEFDCFLSGLSTLNHAIGTWLNKDGQEEEYFVGSNHGEHLCSCGVDNSCSGSDSGIKCNCDNPIPVLQRDNGTLTDVSALPVTGFIYGEMVYPSQFAAVTIGRLRCGGKMDIQPEHIMDSCSNLKTYGVSQSGNYVLNNDSIAFCDMSKSINDEEIQRHIGDLAYNDFLFLAESKTESTLSNKFIAFTKLQVDNSYSFEKETGIFTVPADGSYVFFFNCYYGHAGLAGVDVYVNGKPEREFRSNNGDEDFNDRELSVFWSMD